MPRQSSFFNLANAGISPAFFFARPPPPFAACAKPLRQSEKADWRPQRNVNLAKKIERRRSGRQIFLPLKKARLLTRNSAAGKRPQSKTRIFRRRKSFTSARKWFVFLRQCQTPGGVCIRRAVAQSGSASGLGPEGRGFESLPPDHLLLAFSSIAKIAKSARRARREV